MSLVRRRLLIVLAFLLLATVIKLVYAGWTLGSNDTGHYRDFAEYVAKYGPIGIYGHWTAAPPYNHPPLVGWILALLNLLGHTGLKMTFLVRLPAIAADVVTTLLVFSILRSYRSLRTATAGAVVVAVSPILIIISGYHGNTDPIFLMFALLAFYCLYRRNSAMATAARRAVLRAVDQRQAGPDRDRPAAGRAGAAGRVAAAGRVRRRRRRGLPAALGPGVRSSSGRRSRPTCSATPATARRGGGSSSSWSRSGRPTTHCRSRRVPAGSLPSCWPRSSRPRSAGAARGYARSRSG